MRPSYLQRRPAYTTHNPRSLSPNSFALRGKNNVSVHSEHLWNMMEDVELFPDEVYSLLQNQERNLSNYKRSIEREKQRAAQSLQSLKKEMQHNIDDLKISIFAELDRIYRNYMEKYATLKGEIMEIKRMRDEIEISIENRSGNYASYSGRGQNGKSQISHNASIMKSLEKNTIDVKKYQMFNYIAELQREKIVPLSELSSEIIILTQYENGYYQNKDFALILNNLVDSFKGNLRDIYDRKYQFIREPDTICQKENRPILDQLNQPPVQTQPYFPPTISRLPGAPNPNLYPEVRKSAPQFNRLDETKLIRIGQEQQNIAFQWAQNVNFTQIQSIKSAASDIALCALEVNKNLMAVGSKDGVITIYDTTSGQKVANLRGHKASICKLGLVNFNGKKYLTSGSDHGCCSIVLWDTTTWNMRMKIQYHKAAVTAIVDLLDNRSLVSGSYDKTINVYNLNDEGKMQFNLPVNKTSVTAVLLTCNGNKLVTCGLDDTVSVYQIMRGASRQVETMFLEREIQNNTMICSIITSMINPDLVFLGTKDGKVKLINIDKGEAYKIYNVCNNAVIEMVVIERQTKSDFPLVVCWPCNQECLKIVNTQSGKVTNQMVRGFIEFGCGIGPKSFFLSNGRTMAMLSQSRERQEVNLFKMQFSN